MFRCCFVVKWKQGSWICHVTPFTHWKQTGRSPKCFIYSLVSPSNYNSSHQALSFPHSHRLSHCDVEGAAILKVGQSEHLTSFPNTLLCLFHKSLLIGVHLKKGGLWLLTGRSAEGRGDQSSMSADWNKGSFLEHDSWLQSVIMGFN